MTEMVPAELTRAERRRLDTRTALLDAVIDLLIEQGDDNLSTTDVAARADVAVGTFYNHFLSIDNAIEEAFAHLAPNFAEMAVRTLANPDRAVGLGRMMGFFMCRLHQAPRIWIAARIAGWEISPIGDYLMVRTLRDAGIGIAEGEVEEIRAAAVLFCRLLAAMVDQFGQSDVPTMLPTQATTVALSAILDDVDAIDRAAAAAALAYEEFLTRDGGIGEVGF